MSTIPSPPRCVLQCMRRSRRRAAGASAPARMGAQETERVEFVDQLWRSHHEAVGHPILARGAGRRGRRGRRSARRRRSPTVAARARSRRRARRWRTRKDRAPARRRGGCHARAEAAARRPPPGARAPTPRRRSRCRPAPGRLGAAPIDDRLAVAGGGAESGRGEASRRAGSGRARLRRARPRVLAGDLTAKVGIPYR